MVFFLESVLSVSSMAYTFEYPPAFVSHRPLNVGRSGILPATHQLYHHFFLSRLKFVLKELLTLPKTEYLLMGMQQELVSTA